MSEKCTNRTCYNPPAPGRKSCQRCLDNYKRVSIKARAAARRDGFCTTCKKAPPKRGRVSCQACIDRATACSVAKAESRRYPGSPWCVTCTHRKKAPGRACCPKCAKRKREWKRDKAVERRIGVAA